MKKTIVTVIRKSASQIKDAIMKAKGQFVLASWFSEPTPKAAFKGVNLKKETIAVVRAGINFANLTSVKEGIANGERGEVQPLSWGEWIDFPYVIGHKGNEYIRLYPSNHIPKVKYFANGKEVSKVEFASYLTPSKAKELLNGERKEVECFTIKANNVLNITEDFNVKLFKKNTLVLEKADA
jgi:hypothetical protein